MQTAIAVDEQTLYNFRRIFTLPLAHQRYQRGTFTERQQTWNVRTRETDGFC
jgi:hypothetical protein